VALRFVDSFDHYATANGAQKWTTVDHFSIISPGRFGTGQCMQLSMNWPNVTKTLDAQPTWIIGFATKLGATVSGQTMLTVLQDGANYQADLRWNPDGTLTVTRNGTAVLGGTSTSILTTNIWYYIEFKCTISTSIPANSWQVRVNGQQFINVASGQSSQVTANATANTVRIGGNMATSAFNAWFDDLYMCDGNGTVNNNFLGEVKIVASLPNAAGSNTQWGALSGPNYTNVNQQTPDDDTSYVISGNPGQLDTYAIAGITDTPTNIVGVQTGLYARKDDAATRTLAKVIRSGGINFAGANNNMTNSYAFYLDINETNPATGLPWTKAGLNGAEFGVQEIA